MKEWERKFDEEQKIKEDTLIKNFYKDSSDENKEIDLNKSDNELNNNEIGYEKTDFDNNNPSSNDDTK